VTISIILRIEDADRPEIIRKLSFIIVAGSISNARKHLERMTEELEGIRYILFKTYEIPASNTIQEMVMLEDAILELLGVEVFKYKCTDLSKPDQITF
jgi:hypothetical protein